MTGDGNINAPLEIALNGQHGKWSALHEQSHTLSTTRVEQVCVPIGVRRLTPTECERLQGFPDGWTAGQADSHRYKQLGNAVSVPVAQWIGQRIMEVMR
jgi:site-specific DNA-cytosine methylase